MRWVIGRAVCCHGFRAIYQFQNHLKPCITTTFETGPYSRDWAGFQTAYDTLKNQETVCVAADKHG